MEKITILQAAESPSKRLSKAFILDADNKIQTIGYDRCKYFNIKMRDVGSIDDLSSLLLKIESRSDLMVIRGLPRSEVDVSKKAFRQTFNPNNPEREVHPPQEKPFKDEPISWLMIDVDKQLLPNGIDLVDDADAAIDCVVKQLPAEFQSVTYHWQLSSSAGIFSH